MAGFIHKGVKNILQKNPNDVVFLSALRTPVTRAKKGGLRDAYDHEMLAAVGWFPALRGFAALCLTTAP
jgi:acetyl-CoA acyltransferase 1